MFRRPFRRPLRRPMAGIIPPALVRANQLMAASQYSEAAGIFEQFARGALVRNGPRAPWFFFQAGHARIQAGQVPVGMAHLQQGFTLLASRGQSQQLFQASRRFVTELNGLGLTAEAQQIEDFLKTALPVGFAPASAGAAGKPRVLPTKCTGCGGSIRSDEVEWADDITAECPYCGSLLRAE
jgi:hypothetical protein